MSEQHPEETYDDDVPDVEPDPELHGAQDDEGEPEPDLDEPEGDKQ